MKIKLIGKPHIIMQNEDSIHRYFAWPTAARLKNGKIAVTASGFRLSHICPFGKTVISYSEDEGKTYTAPAPVIDTPLDDRDGGILAFGEQGVIVTSFNNTVKMQKTEMMNKYNLKTELFPDYRLGYLDSVTPEDEEKYLGVTYRASHDGGVSFGEIKKSPVTSPHGPFETADGRIIWVGRVFSRDDLYINEEDKIAAYELDPVGGDMKYLGEIEGIYENGEKLLSCEPYAIELEDGAWLCHIRAQLSGKYFTLYQSVSRDDGKTWSKPERLLSERGGAPAHILKCKDGTLVCTYGFRTAPYGIRAMISRDNGKTWEKDLDIYINGISFDIGYPSTVELEDGTFITVFYAHTEDNGPARIMQQNWELEK